MMQLTTLGNGLRVASRPMASVETVAVGLYAPTGSRYESDRCNGIAHLFEHMVFKGAGGRSARQISEVIEDVGGDLNASTDRELTAFYASLLAPDLALGVSLLADLIRRPHFEPQHLELEKKVVLQELAEARDTASLRRIPPPKHGVSTSMPTSHAGNPAAVLRDSLGDPGGRLQGKM